MAFEPMEDGRMGKKRHKPEEIVAKLRQVKGLTGLMRECLNSVCYWKKVNDESMDETFDF